MVVDGSAGGLTAIAGVSPGSTAIQFTSSSRAEFAPGYNFGNSLVASSSDFNFGPTDSFTIEEEANLSGYGALFGKGLNGNDPQLYMWYDGSSQLFGLTYDGTNAGEANAKPEVISLNTWHHFALVRDATAHTLTEYVDGISVASGSDASLDLTTTGTFSINTQNSGYEYYSGNTAIDFVRVSNVGCHRASFSGQM